jgi:hypothetical protein
MKRSWPIFKCHKKPQRGLLCFVLVISSAFLGFSLDGPFINLVESNHFLGAPIFENPDTEGLPVDKKNPFLGFPVIQVSLSPLSDFNHSSVNFSFQSFRPLLPDQERSPLRC